MEENTLTLEQIVAQLKEEVAGANARLEVNRIKNLFYKAKEQLADGLRAQWIADGKAEEEFVAEFEEENALKALLEESKNKRALEIQQKEAEQEKAYERKKDLLEQLRKIVEQAEETGVEKNFPLVRQLQQAWREAGEVAQSKYAGLVKMYQAYNEQFYDLVKISNELRDYDFKKNLEAKEKLCEAAEKLAEEKQMNVAFQKLQLLHNEWRELGPVMREQREALWERFKTASDVINKKHAAYYQERKSQEVDNLAQKVALCEAIEAIPLDVERGYKQWDEVTEQVLKWQEQWKKIGFAPKKNNTAIYERFRKACDALFEAKSAFYKQNKEILSANLAKKRSLCEQAEALKDSTDWNATTQKLVALQKEWKIIGAVPHKSSDAVWKRFVTVCDAFFDAKKAAAKQQKEERKAAYKEAKSTLSLRKEHDKLMRAYDKIKQEIATRENNISFLSKGSKNGNPLVEQMLQTIDALKKDQKELYNKIIALEKQINNDAQN
ncbi:MAG: DUF349 domain-containing protein [Paludibacteraceae bacterium]|nr:DUF349 domain-containing protein [Paludibacteraceae bacterium]